MDIEGKSIIITGAASGIGKALAERFAREGAEGIVLGDLNESGVKEVADAIGGAGLRTNVAQEADIVALIELARQRHGRVDLFVSNAGVAGADKAIEHIGATSDEQWALGWGVNVMAHVYAARHCLPEMIARGSGYFLNTVSAAGLLTMIDADVYSTTKHAAVGFAESLAISHRSDGVGVSILCPQWVETPILDNLREGLLAIAPTLTPQQVADDVTTALRDERFLILPHKEVHQYMQQKAGDYDRWIGGMVKLRSGLSG